MLRIILPGGEGWDPKREEFVESEEQVLYLEHSLRSIREWEAEYKKPWFTNDPRFDKTESDLIGYIPFMIVEPKYFDPRILCNLTRQQYEEIFKYIGDKRTATWINEKNENPGCHTWGKSIKTETMTTEQIYANMANGQIPYEAENWNINQLMMLIRVLVEQQKKNDPSKKTKLLLLVLLVLEPN